MSISVEHESTEALKKWSLGLDKIQERCIFCGTQTRYWHKKSNKPVCEPCAEIKQESDMKTR